MQEFDTCVRAMLAGLLVLDENLARASEFTHILEQKHHSLASNSNFA